MLLLVYFFSLSSARCSPSCAYSERTLRSVAMHESSMERTKQLYIENMKSEIAAAAAKKKSKMNQIKLMCAYKRTHNRITLFILIYPLVNYFFLFYIHFSLIYCSACNWTQPNEWTKEKATETESIRLAKKKKMKCSRSAWALSILAFVLDFRDLFLFFLFPLWLFFCFSRFFFCSFYFSICMANAVWLSFDFVKRKRERTKEQKKKKTAYDYNTCER